MFVCVCVFVCCVCVCVCVFVCVETEEYILQCCTYIEKYTNIYYSVGSTVYGEIKEYIFIIGYKIQNPSTSLCKWNIRI